MYIKRFTFRIHTGGARWGSWKVTHRCYLLQFFFSCGVMFKHIMMFSFRNYSKRQKWKENCWNPWMNNFTFNSLHCIVSLMFLPIFRVRVYIIASRCAYKLIMHYDKLSLMEQHHHSVLIQLNHFFSSSITPLHLYISGILLCKKNSILIRKLLI
jgi:hypothetical protein